MNPFIRDVGMGERLIQDKPATLKPVILIMTDRREALTDIRGKERSPVPTLTNVGTSGLESNRNDSRSIV